MLIDVGLKADEIKGILNEMEEEELIEEVLNALEYVCIYRSAFDAAKHIVKNQSRKEEVFSDRYMKKLEFSKILSTYSKEQCMEVSDLKFDLKEMAHRLGYAYSTEENGFRCRSDRGHEYLEQFIEIEPYDESDDICFPEFIIGQN